MTLRHRARRDLLLVHEALDEEAHTVPVWVLGFQAVVRPLLIAPRGICRTPGNDLVRPRSASAIRELNRKS